MLDIRDNLEKVQQAVERACLRAGRKPADVLVIAVSKTVEIERITQALDAGVKALGENRVRGAEEQLTRELDRRAHQAGRVARVLVQVNLGGERQKGGVLPAEIKRLLDAITGCRNLDVRGLMCIPPAAESAEASRLWFRRLRELRDASALEHCSMGMSGGFEGA